MPDGRIPTPVDLIKIPIWVRARGGGLEKEGSVQNNMKGDRTNLLSITFHQISSLLVGNSLRLLIGAGPRCAAVFNSHQSQPGAEKSF